MVHEPVPSREKQEGMTVGNNNYYGMDGMGWYDFARRMGFNGTPEQLMAIMLGNIERLADHALLANRDADAQHPMSAIAGLEDELLRLERKIDEIKGG